MNVVTERNFDQVYTRDVRDAYWEQVARSLERVFGQNRALADTYRQEIERAPTSEQILVYHQEPIEVAADLAGVTQITPDQQKIYIEIAGDTEPPRAGWPDVP
jgi:hypothetical protein